MTPEAEDSQSRVIPETGPPKDFRTEANDYGVFRVYKGGKPTFIPDQRYFDFLADSSNFNVTSARPKRPSEPSKGPFDNSTTELLMSWFYNGTTVKSSADLNRLVREVLMAPGFDADHLSNFDASKAAKNLDDYNAGNPRSVLTSNDGWIETSVEVSLPPAEHGSRVSESAAPKYSVSGLFYRKPLEVIKAALAESTAKTFHIIPFQQYWRPFPSAPSERLYSEIYNSDIHIEEYKQLRAEMAGSDVDPVIIPILVWSDSTHLSTFGNASLWPAYMYIGSQSKYDRGKPSAFAAHHLAYFPKVCILKFVAPESRLIFLCLFSQLDDAIQDFYVKEFGKPATAEVLTHLRRELMHAVWRLILDDEFKEACVKGIDIPFLDGTIRRIFIRFYIYVADYPEK